MKRYRAVTVLACIVLLLYGGKFAMNQLFGPSDDQLIQQSLQEAIKASSEGRPGGVLDNLSLTFKVNDSRFSPSQVADFIRKQRPAVTMARSTPLITGDAAQIRTSASVDFSFLGSTQTFEAKEAVVRFQRETGTDWLLLPVRKWRVVQVEVPMEQLPAGLGGF